MTMSDPTPDPTLVSTRSPSQRRPGKWRIADIIDGRALRVKLEATALDNISDEAARRKAALELLHGALFRGRIIAQERLQQGADGLDTSRLLSAVQDEVISALYYFTTQHVFGSSDTDEPACLAVMATGGYGRGVMAPSSDTDLLFLRAGKDSEKTESIIEYMLYILWDMGLKVGHAFRSPADCIRLSDEDITIKTSLLDARFLCGNEELASEMRALFVKEIVKGNDKQFIADKLAERDARHARLGDARYVVEPNIKEGKGGLRDLQTLYWIVKHSEGGETLEDVMRSGMFTPHEYVLFMRAARFLWTVRCHIHYVTGRAEETLSFDLQSEIAARMGYQDRSGQLGVERFMKRYFLIAKDVGGLTRILAAKLEAQKKKKPEGLRRFIPKRGPHALKGEGTQGFVLDGGRISVTHEEVMAEDPLNMLRLFLIARNMERDVHPDAVSAVTRHLKAFNAEVRKKQEARRLMLDVLVQSDEPGLILRRMNEAGILGRAIPEFGGIVAQTQFNMYHHYTVDEHTIRAIEAIADMEFGRDLNMPESKTLFGLIENRRALYLAMLLHDTGKGRGDQQVEGRKTAAKACARLGLPEAETGLVSWLVGTHLEMSETAQKRDISDPRTIAKFAKLVGSVERLRLLYILTIADIKAVGPGVWNGWKGQLLAELYHATNAALRGGRTDEASVMAALERQAQARREELGDYIANIPPQMLGMESAYWNGFDIPDLSWHGDALSACKGACVQFRPQKDDSAVIYLVAGHDRSGLFADLAGVIAAQGANIVTAQVYTSETGCIIDVFVLQNARGTAFGRRDPARLERLRDKLGEVLAGTLRAGEVKARQGRREAAFEVQPIVQIRNDLSADYTVIDLTGRDRPGLLHEVSSVLADSGLVIHSAHVGSYGERVFDAFYVATETGQKLTQKDLEESLQTHLLAVLGREEPDAPQTPVRKLKRSRAVDSF